MAFAARNLSVLSYANGFTLWHYTTTDNNTAVIAGNYFNAASDLVRKGDLIVANVDTGGTQANKMYFVASVASGVVTITTAV
ncbi:MAG: hypothetical protein JWM96_222 [Alphaproteobacteria bacterium]|nr:hypothetical protein [Alphaproteobacteria bacterium]